MKTYLIWYVMHFTGYLVWSIDCLYELKIYGVPLLRPKWDIVHLVTIRFLQISPGRTISMLANDMGGVQCPKETTFRLMKQIVHLCHLACCQYVGCIVLILVLAPEQVLLVVSCFGIVWNILPNWTYRGQTQISRNHPPADEAIPRNQRYT